jgi:hypothetical protein
MQSAPDHDVLPPSRNSLGEEIAHGNETFDSDCPAE